MQQSVVDLCSSLCVKSPFLGNDMIPEIPHSGGLFPKYVSLQTFNKHLSNLGSRQRKCDLVLGLCQV